MINQLDKGGSMATGAGVDVDTLGRKGDPASLSTYVLCHPPWNYPTFHPSRPSGSPVRLSTVASVSRAAVWSTESRGVPCMSGPSICACSAMSARLADRNDGRGTVCRALGRPSHE